MTGGDLIHIKCECLGHSAVQYLIKGPERKCQIEHVWLKIFISDLSSHVYIVRIQIKGLERKHKYLRSSSLYIIDSVCRAGGYGMTLISEKKIERQTFAMHCNLNKHKHILFKLVKHFSDTCDNISLDFVANVEMYSRGFNYTVVGRHFA